MTAFTYSNVSGRRRGPLLSVAGLFLRGIPEVQAQAVPFAEAWQRGNMTALGATGPLWIALGDSLTQGIGAPSHDRGWVGQLRERLAAQGRDYRVVNLSVSGARSGDVLSRQLPVLKTLPAPDLVTLMIGSNDLIRPKYRNELSGNIEQILRRLPSSTVVTTLPNPSRVAGAANRAIATVARERGQRVAELRDSRTTSWRGKLAADHFHPNEAGYAALADVIAGVVL